MRRHGTISWNTAGPTFTGDAPSAELAISAARSCTPRTVYGLWVADSAAFANGADSVSASTIKNEVKNFELFMAPSELSCGSTPINVLNVGAGREFGKDGCTERAGGGGKAVGPISQTHFR